MIKKIIGLFETLLITFFVVSMVFTFCFATYTIDGESMESTLSRGDTVLVSKICFSEKAGDIIIADTDKAVTFDENGNITVKNVVEKLIVKRVIAAEGQTVSIDFAKGKVYVDGNELREDYASGLTHLDEGAFTGKYPVKVPEGYLFVMGDNRRNSLDSRSSELGFVSVKDVEGKVIMRMAPTDKFGKVK